MQSHSHTVSGTEPGASLITDPGFVNPAVLSLTYADPPPIGRGQISTGRKRHHGAYTTEDELRNATPRLLDVGMDHDTLFRASALRAAQVQRDRREALESMAWERQCEQLECCPLPSLLPSITPFAVGGPEYGSSATLPVNNSLSVERPVVPVDFDHELEFELNTAMGQTWTTSVSTLPPEAACPLLIESQDDLLGPAVTADTPSTASPWTPLPMAPPYGSPCYARPATDSPEGGFSPPQAVAHAAALGLSLSEKTKSDMMLTT